MTLLRPDCFFRNGNALLLGFAWCWKKPGHCWWRMIAAVMTKPHDFRCRFVTGAADASAICTLLNFAATLSAFFLFVEGICKKKRIKENDESIEPWGEFPAPGSLHTFSLFASIVVSEFDVFQRKIQHETEKRILETTSTPKKRRNRRRFCVLKELERETADDLF